MNTIKPYATLRSTVVLVGRTLLSAVSWPDKSVRPTRTVKIEPPSRPGVRLAQAVGCGLALAVAQLVLACFLTGQSEPIQAYRKLVAADGGWYASIVEAGYLLPVRYDPPYYGQSNLAFFPGYPMIARSLKWTFGLRTDDALLLTSQLACWIFWTYLLLFFQRWEVPGKLAAAGAAVILVHPAAFYLVTSYSESIYLMALLGFIYWADSKPLVSKPLAVLHGMVMTATRLVGLPLVIYPFIRTLLNTAPDRSPSGRGAGVRDRLRASVSPALIGGIAAFGCAFFFGYCHWRFDRWNMYMTVEEAWNVRPHYWALFSQRILHVHWPQLSEGFIDPDFLSRLSVPLTLLSLVAVIAFEWSLARRHTDTGWRQRVGFYLCAWMMLYVSASGRSSVVMAGMIRYTFCVYVMLIIALVHLFNRVGIPAVVRGKRAAIFMAMSAICSFSFQVALTYRYTHGKWVA